MGSSSSAPGEIISLPKGGGALHGLGETFSPDLHTGTGNFTVPIALPPGRNGFQPEINLVYSTGNGNGLFGLGWKLSIPGVARKTSPIPRFRDEANDPKQRDTFILSGAEDLVPVDESVPGVVRYRPRTEGLFARIERHYDAANDYWIVRSKDGLVSFYGTARPGPVATPWEDPATIRKPRLGPSDRDRVFAWHLTLTIDSFGNRIEYLYDERDQGSAEDSKKGHDWDRPLLSQIQYVDYESGGRTQFLVTVGFEYELRPDPFSEYRPGFEIRTAKRCKAIFVETHAEHRYKIRRYEFQYNNDSLNGVSQLVALHVVGFDDIGAPSEQLPPLEFRYSDFNPQDQKRRDFYPVKGHLPAVSLANPALELVDLFSHGLPDILEMNGTVRFWRNLGDGCFDTPRPMPDAPADLALADPGVQIVDANGDGLADLLVTRPGLSGYFPLQFGAQWDRRSMRKYESSPSFSLKDPDVRLIDLTGDGVTDAVRSGARLECFFNDPDRGWLPHNTRFVNRKTLERFPDITFSNPRLKIGDMSGDGMQDFTLINDGHVEYWPNLGYGSWGKRVPMLHSPRFPFDYDPKRILVGDIDGDGLADIIYVDDRKIHIWINQSGNAWSDEIVVQGTPPVSDMDAVRLTDLLGSGIAGVLWTTDASLPRHEHYLFLDLTGGTKPYLLHEIDNNIGALTKVAYAPSTNHYLRDQKNHAMPWLTPLPFPVQVVARVEVIDKLSKGKLTTEFKYHNGYWDGVEREFRGFGMVERLDTASADSRGPSMHASPESFAEVDRKHFSPPTLTKTWFHLGAVGEEGSAWHELDYAKGYWQDDPPLLDHRAMTDTFLASTVADTAILNRRAKRDALRALRGSVLRTELYGLDASGPERETRPYTVTENAYGLVEIDSLSHREPTRARIFFPHSTVQRTTQWERGHDPMTLFSFVRYEYLDGATGQRTFDEFGRPRSHTSIAMPRRSVKRRSLPSALPGHGSLDEMKILATHTRTEYASPASQDTFIHDRVSQNVTYELFNAATVNETTPTSVLAVLQDQIAAARATEATFDGLPADAVHLIAHTINHYDGAPFSGLEVGHIGQHGALMRNESLVATADDLDGAYGARRPAYLGGIASPPPGSPPGFGGAIGYRLSPTPSGVMGYYADSSSRALDDKGLPIARRDPLGNPTIVSYDRFQWLPVHVTDPVGNLTAVEYNYRVIQPKLVTDPNGNQTRFHFSPLGMTTEIWACGNPTKTEGDRTRPSSRFEYDFMAFRNASPDNRQPICVRAIRQERHDSDATATADELKKTIETREYSDGFGRLLQTRVQGEELRFGDSIFGGGNDVLPMSQADNATAPVIGVRNTDPTKPNVVVSGWKIYDNKGRVVEEFEPFFSSGWQYLAPGEAELGQRVSTFYEPRGRVVRMVNPDGSEQRVVFGIPPDLRDPNRFEPTPWETVAYDANDLAPVSLSATDLLPDGSFRSLKDGAPSSHYFTPTTTVIDGLNRTTALIRRNGSVPATDWFVTRSRYDIRGNVLSVIDALGREVFEHRYDLLNRLLRVRSIDLGLRTSVFDALGNLIEYRDGKGSIALRRYNSANRLIEVWAVNDPSQPLTQRERIDYADTLTLSELSVGQATDLNLIGKPRQHYDEAGLVEFVRYDFKGNLLEKARRVISDNALASDWVANWSAADAISSLDEPSDAYTTSSTYDALNRVSSATYPADVIGTRATLTPSYNRAGSLEAVMLNGSSYVALIAYNAKGRRVLAAYGNGVMTRYAYDSRTFRLARLRTETNAGAPGTDTKIPGGAPLQDYAYRYDLSGNIVSIVDRTAKSGVNGNIDQLRWRLIDPHLASLIATGDALARDFEYDPLYRLISATGREGQSIPSARPWGDYQPDGFYVSGTPTPSQDNASDVSVSYSERYTYDPLGNMVNMNHSRGGPNVWVRSFGMGELSPSAWDQEWRSRLNAPHTWANPRGNHLTHVGDDQPNCPQTHRFDPNGNLIQENMERHFSWDHADRLIKFVNRAAASATPSVDARYLYGADGTRIKKWTRKNGANGPNESTVYVDGVFEHHRWQENGQTKQNNHLHVMDNQDRVALRRIGPAHQHDAGPAIQFVASDHLGSIAVVVSDAGAWINREEFFPYGETSFGSFAKKRYRFTGQERDEETGLTYHQSRYYTPWLGRWANADPAGIVDGVNVYLYASRNPLRLRDSTGTTGEPTSEEISANASLAGSDAVCSATGNTAPDGSNTVLGGFQKQDRNNLNSELSREFESVGDILTRLGELTGSEKLSKLGTHFTGSSKRFQEAQEPIEGTREKVGAALSITLNLVRKYTDEKVKNLRAGYHAPYSPASGPGPEAELLGPETATGEADALTEPPSDPKAYSTVFEKALDPADYGNSRDVHFRRANETLDAAMRQDRDLCDLIEDLSPGAGVLVCSYRGRRTPAEHTWEHASTATAFGEPGVLRLVPTSQHTPGSAFWRILHPDPGAAGGYSEWAIPAGAPPNK